MKYFLQKLSSGIEKKGVQKNEEPLFLELQNLNIIKQKGKFYYLQDGFTVGILDVSRDGTGFLKVLFSDNQRDLIIEPRFLGHAAKKDLVIAKLTEKKRGRPSAKIVYIVEKEFETIVVYTKSIKSQIVGINIKTEQINHISATQKSLKQLPPSTILKLDSKTNEIKEVLGVLSDSKVDEKISLALYNKNDLFSKKAELEAQSYGCFVDKYMYEERIDLTRLPFCTIDPESAKDFDDAIYFDKKTSTIYVAIADVSEYVHENTQLDKEAQERGFSIYFPHKSVPMLPRTLSENICSLKPNEDRLAFCFSIKIDPKTLSIKKEELSKVIINSKRRFTYEEIDVYLDGNYSNCDKTDHSILKYLLPLWDLIKNLRYKRVQSACEFSGLEVTMNLDENQNLTSVKIEKETNSHKLIEDCMLLANQAAAKMLHKKGIFRTHDKPSIEKIQSLIENLSQIGIYEPFQTDIYEMFRKIQIKAKELGIKEQVDKLLIKSQKQAEYSSQNIGHFGLGFEAYSHFTSPIRRYSDLVLHRILKTFLEEDERKREYLLKNIDSICLKTSDLERECDRVMWDYQDRKYARFALANKDKVFEGIVVDTNKNPIASLKGELFGARVFLNNFDVNLFEQVFVKITDVNLATTKIYADIVK